MRLITFLLLSVFTLSSFHAQGQADTLVTLQVKKNIPVHFQVGLNAPLLLGNLLNGNNNSNTVNPYLLTGKLLVGTFALRLGGGGEWLRSVEREGAFADSRTTENKGFDGRAGLEWQQNFGRRWVGTFGADAIFFFNKNKEILDSGFDVVTTGTTTSGWGGGPVIGLQFFITERLSLLTEGAFYYTRSEVQTSRLFQNFPEFDDELGTLENEELRINLPATFFIVYQF